MDESKKGFLDNMEDESEWISNYLTHSKNILRLIPMGIFEISKKIVEESLQLLVEEYLRKSRYSLSRKKKSLKCLSKDNAQRPPQWNSWWNR